jgi:hypothetical protein
MPHAVQDVQISPLPQKARQRPKGTSLPRELVQLTSQLLNLQDLFNRSQLSVSLNRHLRTLTKTNASITRIVSLGLGSLLVSKGQSRRLKQLAILLAIRDHLQEEGKETIEVYAQDPTFTRQDEALLASLGIHILRTASGSDLGEAVSFISSTTLVYSPFLTLEAYEQLILKPSTPVQYLVGDDFDALQKKWPKRSAEKKQVESVLRSGLSKYRRRAVAGEDFWTDGDETFPMAVYVNTVAMEAPRLRARM